MRKLFFPLPFILLFFTACNSNKTKERGTSENTPEVGQHNDYLITADGIGAVKLGMSQEEVEKIINKKILLTNPTDTSGSWVDSALVKYKEADLKLDFVRSYTVNDSFYMRVTTITTGHLLCQTARGIGIGSTKQQIIDAYERSMLIMVPDYDNDTDTVYSKTKYLIKVRESWEGPQFVFYLKNNKTYSIEVGTFYDDAE